MVLLEWAVLVQWVWTSEYEATIRARVGRPVEEVMVGMVAGGVMAEEIPGSRSLELVQMLACSRPMRWYLRLNIASVMVGVWVIWSVATMSARLVRIAKSAGVGSIWAA